MITTILIFSLLFTPFLDEQKAPPKFKNIIILLDLSNRIKPNKNPNQAKKDQQIIEALLQSFQERQRQFLFLNSKDKFSIIVANQKDSKLDLYQYGEALNIDMANPDKNRRMTKPAFDNEKKALTDALISLYSEAVETKTTGADIWSFFKDELKAELKPSTEYENYVIVLTDGYMDLDKVIADKRPTDTYMSYRKEIHHLRNKENWEKIFENKNMGLRPHDIDFINLKALVLEVDPKDPVVNINEMQIIKHFWGNWFEQMNISYEIHSSNDNIGATKNQIDNFIFN